MIPPFLVELDEFLEFSLKIVGRCVGNLLLFRGRVKIDVRRRLREVHDFCRGFAIAGQALLQVGFGDGSFLQDWILLQFLLDESF
jgi:hypothetical protein